MGYGLMGYVLYGLMGYLEGWRDFVGLVMAPGSLSPNVVDEDELEEWGINEEHGEPVPNVHGRQVRDDGEGRTEAIATISYHT